MKKIVTDEGSKKEIYTVELSDEKITAVKSPLGYLPVSLWPRAFIPVEAPTSDVNLTDLLEKHLHILFRETRSLMESSSRGKLDKDSSYSMRENIKLLMELIKKEKELLNDIPMEELKKLINAKT